MERSRTQFEVDLQTGSSAAERADASLPAGSRAAGTGDPVCDRAVVPGDRERSGTELSGGRRGPAEEIMARRDRGPVLCHRPGHPGLAAESCVRPFPARANRLVGLCAPLRSAGLRGLSALSSLADPAAVSELPRSGSPRPCRVRGVRNALSGSCPQGNRDLRLKRWRSPAGDVGNRCSVVDPTVSLAGENQMVLAIVRKELRETRAVRRSRARTVSHLSEQADGKVGPAAHARCSDGSPG